MIDDERRRREEERKGEVNKDIPSKAGFVLALTVVEG